MSYSRLATTHSSAITRAAWHGQQCSAGFTVGASRVLVASHCPPTDRLEPDSSFSVLRLFDPKSTGLHRGKVNLVRANGAMSS